MSSKNKHLNILDSFKDNITIILLVFYSLSFINYYLYYKSFDISIFNYIGLNDLLFFSVEYIFKFLLLIVLCEMILFIIYVLLFTGYEKFVIFFIKKNIEYINYSKSKKERIDKVFSKIFKATLPQFKLWIVFAGIFAIAILPYKMFLFPAHLIYLIYLLNKSSDFEDFEMVGTFGSIIIIISMIIFTLVNSYDKRFEKDSYNISFKESDKYITTDPKYSFINYLGETSSYIFLYDIKTKQSKIFNKQNILELKIKNTTAIDEYIKYFKSSFVYNHYKEMISH